MKRQIGDEWWQVVVDRHDKTPPYLQIAATIRHKIATGELAPGSSLPSVRVLMKIAGVTTTTVTRSYHLLQEEGLISIQPGVGAVVQETKPLAKRGDQLPDALVAEIDDLVHRILQQGFGSHVLERTLKARLHKATSSRYVIFTTAEAAVSAHYANVLHNELSQIGVRCVPVPLAALLRMNNETQRLIADAEHIFTALPIYREVEERVSGFTDTPVSHLLTQITLATHERLQAIEPTANVVLLMQRRYRASAHGLMLGYVEPEKLTLVRSFTKVSVEAAISEADVVVHSVGTRANITGASEHLGDKHVIELEYAIRPDVLNKVRDLL